MKGREPYAAQINDSLQPCKEASLAVYRNTQKEKKLLTELEFKQAVIRELKGEQAAPIEAEKQVLFLFLANGDLGKAPSYPSSGNSP
ncbi:hypothetical protein [Rufibacter latericius]|uniref:Uncharacterized protein n=1 Tax=Rufibacter latericius TaxID=2487040 RepID=A0A3M9MAX5_9BACT|nr:hypothetical protein [Rufibacter latericius]RNI22023.1 hypothetical protein EFB08_23100 [Rufibacter latericius]